MTGANHAQRNEEKWLARLILMETIGPVPALTSSIAKHARSIFSMKIDRGMVHALLEEAENERTHLFLFM